MARSKDISGIYRFVACTPGSGAFEECRAVIASTAGTISCVDATGNALTALPVIVGVNPYQLTNITAASGSLGLFLGY
jgi:hypothetical protein